MKQEHCPVCDKMTETKSDKPYWGRNTDTYYDTCNECNSLRNAAISCEFIKKYLNDYDKLVDFLTTMTPVESVILGLKQLLFGYPSLFDKLQNDTKLKAKIEEIKEFRLKESKDKTEKLV